MPAPPPIPKKPSIMGDGDRALISRRRTPQAGAPIVPQWTEPEPETGVHERAARMPDERTDHLEKRVDVIRDNVSALRLEMIKEVGGLKSGIGELAGEVGGLATVVRETLADRRSDRDAKIEIDKGKELDVLHANKSRRERWGRVVYLLTSGGLVVEVLHHLGVL